MPPALQGTCLGGQRHTALRSGSWYQEIKYCSIKVKGIKKHFQNTVNGGELSSIYQPVYFNQEKKKKKTSHVRGTFNRNLILKTGQGVSFANCFAASIINLNAINSVKLKQEANTLWWTCKSCTTYASRHSPTTVGIIESRIILE